MGWGPWGGRLPSYCVPPFVSCDCTACSKRVQRVFNYQSAQMTFTLGKGYSRIQRRNNTFCPKSISLCSPSARPVLTQARGLARPRQAHSSTASASFQTRQTLFLHFLDDTEQKEMARLQKTSVPSASLPKEPQSIN